MRPAADPFRVRAGKPHPRIAMPDFSPTDIARWTGGKWTQPPSTPLTGFCFDSRQVRAGDVFVAVRSEKADGHNYVAAAFAAGAAAAIVSRIPEPAPSGPLLVVSDTLAAFCAVARGWRRQVNPFVVGVTGSVGKSTVKEWTAALLADWRPTASTVANFNNAIGLPYSLLAMAPGTAFGVFEAGMNHPGELAPLCEAMAPNAAIITAIAPVHIEFFPSLAAIADEKATLLRALPPDGFAVLDACGEFFGYLSSQAPCRVVGACAIDPGATPPEGAPYVARIVSEANGEFLLSGPGLAKPVRAALGRPGRHNVVNAVLAVAAARECGVPWDVIAARLSRLPSMALRWERSAEGGINWICDAYNASPTSMASSIRAFALAAPPPRRKVPPLQALSTIRAFAALGNPGVFEMRGGAPCRAFVLGDMLELGADAVEYHRGIGRVLGEIETVPSDVLVCVGPLAANYAGQGFKGRVFHADDATDAARILRRELPQGSTVLLKASHSLSLEETPARHRMPVAELDRPNPRAVVLGAGRSGQAAKRLLESSGAEVVLLDGDVQFPEADLCLAVVSPGIPAEHPWLAACAARGIPVVSELELGFRFWRGRILAVTGSKGKSSVVKLCADALAMAGDTAAPCGNYGTPLCELVLSEPPPHWAVVEVSSFQLERVSRFRPDIAVLLNLHADHLDRHGTIERYAETKFRLFARFHAEDDVAFVEADAFRRALAAGAAGAERLAASAGADAAAAGGAEGILAFGAAPSRGLPAPPASGYFSARPLRPAATAAGLALAAAGLDAAEIEEAFGAFSPLPHRMEVVAERDGVVFIDNSKATSLAALAASLEMAGRPSRLIAGGRLKEKDLDPAKIQLANFAKKVYLIGECSRSLYEAWHEAVPCEECGTMEAAVMAAARDAGRGEAVLLAPGCASFDQFGGYAERGDRFALCVRKALQSTAR